MKRDLERYLVKWKDSPRRMPLLLRGARQVGKSYLVTEFGKKYFSNLVTVNFELRPELIACFAQRDPDSILKNLRAVLHQEIIPGKTLLFLDEAQDCPNAIMALRYFKENMPELHVIAAGSLLEFVLNSPDFRMPVGRVQFLHLQPLSFLEYLDAKGLTWLRELIETVEKPEDISPIEHEQLLQLVTEYIFIGGMPASVNAYLEDQDFEAAREQQSILLTTYRNDFGKYANHVQLPLLQRLFLTIPSHCCQQVQYSKLAEDWRAREVKVALDLLQHAGLIHRVFASKAIGVPLEATMNHKQFKLLFVDTGLMAYGSNSREETWRINHETILTKGMLVEHFVGQQLLTVMDPREHAMSYYWARDKRNSQAELDYVFASGSKIIPVEVKAGKSNSLKSLRLYQEETKNNLGIQCSVYPLKKTKDLLKLPLYMISEVERMLFL